jgi:hypothetical protein
MATTPAPGSGTKTLALTNDNRPLIEVEQAVQCTILYSNIITNVFIAILIVMRGVTALLLEL